MRWYFVMHPNIDITAKVQAPTSEKARTALLDYLERTGKIYRKDRQTYRSNMVVDKISNPSDVDSSIELSYDYIEEPEIQMPNEVGISEEIQPVQEGGDTAMSPLQKLVLTGKV